MSAIHGSGPEDAATYPAVWERPVERIVEMLLVVLQLWVDVRERRRRRR